MSSSSTESNDNDRQARFVNILFEVMDEVLANRDQYTFEHVVRVAAIATAIGKRLGLGSDELASLKHGCLIHDIGKIAIPDDVLLKPARFTRHERDIIRYHPLVGAKLVVRHIRDERIIDIILNHHERLDGSGYPNGLMGEEIGLLPRIVAVADTYEALVAQRPYKKALPPAEALAELHREAKAGQLDAQMVAVLEEVVPEVDATPPPHPVTAGFMKDIELFRSRTYFREPLSDFYNYRYLLFLDDAGVLRRNLPYRLVLIGFPDFGDFQERVGHFIADQVFDEIGQNLLDCCTAQAHRRERYDGSMMVFRKAIDYLLYLEVEEGDNCEALLAPIRGLLVEREAEWGLKAVLQRVACDAGQPLAASLRKLLAITGRRGAGPCPAVRPT